MFCQLVTTATDNIHAIDLWWHYIVMKVNVSLSLFVCLHVHSQMNSLPMNTSMQLYIYIYIVHDLPIYSITSIGPYVIVLGLWPLSWLFYVYWCLPPFIFVVVVIVIVHLLLSLTSNLDSIDIYLHGQLSNTHTFTYILDSWW